MIHCKKSTIMLSLMAAAIAGGVIGPFIVWFFDRNPPYIRNSGMIVPEDPTRCGLTTNGTEYLGKITPGACVAIEWDIDILRTDCRPVSDFHVSRWIRTDTDGVVHMLPPTARVFGPGKRPITNPLRRPFIYPENASLPGPATYHSESCYICNPYQWLTGSSTCVSQPDAFFIIDDN